MRVLLVLIFSILLAAAPGLRAQFDPTVPPGVAKPVTPAPAVSAAPVPAAAPAQPAAVPPPSAAQPSVTMPGRPTSMPVSLPAPRPGLSVPGGGKQSAGTINFQGTPLAAVLEYYARLAKRSIIQAPNLSGVIYFTSQSDLTVEEALQALDTVLAINGIGVLPMGEKFLKVVQIATAKTEGISVGVSEGKGLPPADSLVTQIIPLKFADASEVTTALQPYLHPFGQLMALAKSNSILITETGGNINQMLEIVKFIDVPSAGRMETKIYILSYAKAADVVSRLQSIIQESQQMSSRGSPTPSAPQPMPMPSGPRPFGGTRAATGGTAGAPSEDQIIDGKVIITPDDRTNKIFLLSRPSNFQFFDEMIAELDAKVEPDIQTKVIELQYADANDAASLINSLISGGSPTSSSATRRTSSTSTSGTARPTTMIPPPPMGGMGGAAGAAGAAALEAAGFFQYAEGVRVIPDQRTNSLLIMATKADLERLEKLIGSIDTSVAQVLVEVVIGEVTLDDTLQVGVNMLKRLSENSGGMKSMGGTTPDTSLPTPPPDLSGLAAGSGLPTGVALSSALTYFATFTKLNLDVAIRLLHSTSNFRVLSTPIVQTLHNQPASIIVGESRPIITSTLSGVNTVTSSNNIGGSFQSNVEYKDIAIELNVTPKINPDGYVAMEIDQKINDIGGFVTISGNEQPIITKREAKSMVSCKDQNTIVLGGLIKEQKGVTETKTPFLGDLPFLGHLFKTKTNTKTRTELLVFIKPTVLRTASQSVAEVKRRLSMLKAVGELGVDKRIDEYIPTPTNQPPSRVEPPKDDQSKAPGVPPVAPVTVAPAPVAVPPPVAVPSPVTEPTPATPPAQPPASQPDQSRQAAKSRYLRGLAPEPPR